jgi:outer membrane protein OmpA-like peptidoglycan-associated protein
MRPGIKRLAGRVVLAALFLTGMSVESRAQRLQPQWWFGVVGGANFNFYSGSTTPLTPLGNEPTFGKGSGTGLFLAPLLEYRHNDVWGGMLTLGFDGRGGSFDNVAVNGVNHTLSTSMNYISIEPSLRINPVGPGFYVFAGPRIAFNASKGFDYAEQGSATVHSDWTNTRGTVLTGQIGVGYDFPLTSADNQWQVQLSPFVAGHFGQGPRSVEDWSLSSVRAGIALKFGSSREVRERVSQEVQFSVRAPRIIPMERTVNETFPVRNYVFFDERSTSIPDRYVRLSASDAATFTEEHLLEPQPKDLTGRSRRQLTVYHNVLNILGDRMRKNAQARVTLVGSSPQGSATGRAMAEAVKNYLVDAFGVNGGRISTEGRDKPAIPSMVSGATRELDLVRPEDNRVEITSNTPELLQPVKIISLQEDPLDSDVLFTVSGAEEMLASWTLEATGDDGRVQRFGPYTSNQERINGKLILGDKLQGRYTITLVGEAKGGQTVRKEQTIRLVRSDEPERDLGLRFSILFEFDQSKTVSTYERFLTNTVAPLIPDGASVIIHGHTDVIGEESYNLKLSQNRAREAQAVIERALASAGKRRVKFDTYGFGEDPRRAPFENRLPEERFYNRTVIIDIVAE